MDFYWDHHFEGQGGGLLLGCGLIKGPGRQNGGLGYADGWAGYPDHDLGAGGRGEVP